MAGHSLGDYHDWLQTGRVYRFPNRRENGRMAIVTAKQSTFGKVWLLYEQIADELDLRYWVMPDGGIAQAREDAPRGRILLGMLAPLANVQELEDITSGLDPALREEIEEILRRLDAEEGHRE